jgi:ParB family transcriptional regulator, chromosome partitioning protein
VQHQDVLLDLLRFCGSCTVNAVQTKTDRPGCERLVHAGQLATALRIDMADWFRPAAGNYFSRIDKTGILDAALGPGERPNDPHAPIFA